LISSQQLLVGGSEFGRARTLRERQRTGTRHVCPSTQGKSAPTRWAGGRSKETAVQANAGHDGSDNAEGDLPGDPASVGKRARTIRPAIRSFRSFAGEKARGGLGSGLPLLRTDRSGMRRGWGDRDRATQQSRLRGVSRGHAWQTGREFGVLPLRIFASRARWTTARYAGHGHTETTY
jgi:hypothetical protein